MRTVRRDRVPPQRRWHGAPQDRVARDPGRLDAGRVERGDGLAGGDGGCGHDRDVCGRASQAHTVKAEKRGLPNLTGLASLGVFLTVLAISTAGALPGLRRV